MAVNMGEAVGYLDLDISKFKSSLEEAKNEANSTTQSIAEKTGKNLQSAGKSIAAAGSTLTKSVTVPIVAAGTAAVKTTANFDSAMSKVSAVSGATGNQLQALRDKAKEMGAQTKFSATESAQAFNYMAMAGWKTEDMLEGIDGIMALSAADGLDLATTSDIVTDALTAFGLSAKDSTHFADVLAQASRNANTNVSMLGESFKYVAPVAGSMGYSVEDVSIALGLMANNGIKASQSGTALRQALSQLVSPTDKVESVMQKYDITLFDTEGQSKSLMEVMEDLRDRFGGITVDMDKATEAAEQGDEAWQEYADSLPISDQEKMQALVDMFGTRAMPAMLAIINTTEEDFGKLSNAISNADGTAQEMADTMLNNLNGQLTLLKSALEGLAISLGELLMPLISQLVGWIQQLVDWLNSLDDSQKETILRIGAIVAVVGPVLLIVGKLVAAIGTIITAGVKIFGVITKLGTAIKGLVVLLGGISAPVLAIVAVIGALIAAFVWLWNTNEDFRNKVIEIWEAIRETLKDIITGIADFFVNAWNGLVSFMSKVWETIKNVIVFAIMAIGSILDAAFQIITLPFRFIWENCKEYIIAAWEVITSVVETAINKVKDIIEPILEAIEIVFNIVWDNITSFVGQAWDKLKSKTSSAMESIKEKISEIWGNIKQDISNITDGIKNVVGPKWESMKQNISNSLSGIKDTFTKTFDGIKDYMSKVVDWLKGIFNFKWELPNVKLPHFSIDGEFSLNPPSVPKLKIDWYKKAMNDGIILNSPAIFGYDPVSGHFMGGGEAGSETVVGTSSLMNMVTKAVDNAIGNISNQLGGDVIIPVYVGGDLVDTYVVTATDRKNYRSGGR